jgi:hypothetical protein
MLAIVAVGSATERRATANSDVDLALLTVAVGAHPYRQMQLGGVVVDIQEIDYRWLLQGARSRFVDLRTLREISRVKNGILLWQRDGAADRLVADSVRPTLSPTDASVLLFKTSKNLRLAALCEWSFEERLWLVRGAAYALCTLALSLTNIGYQKAKWLLEDLRRTGNDRLALTVADLLGGRLHDGPPAERIVASVRSALLEACGKLNLPPLMRGKGVPFEYTYARRTFGDAMAMLEAGHTDAACLAADYALRFMNVLVAEQSSEGEGRDRRAEWAIEWRRAAMSDLQAIVRLDATTINELSADLADIGMRLERDYKRAAAGEADVLYGGS